MPSLTAQVNTTLVGISQVAPTILSSLKLDPKLLPPVQNEGTVVLPGLSF